MTAPDRSFIDGAEQTFLEDVEAHARMVAAAFGVTLDELRGPSREQPLPSARGAVALYLRRELGWGLPRIGRFLRRHHTTIMASMRTAAARERG